MYRAPLFPSGHPGDECINLVNFSSPAGHFNSEGVLAVLNSSGVPSSDGGWDCVATVLTLLIARAVVGRNSLYIDPYDYYCYCNHLPYIGYYSHPLYTQMMVYKNPE